MEDKYFRIWRIMQERLARREEDDKLGADKGAMYCSLLSEMAILEAEAVLEE